MIQLFKKRWTLILLVAVLVFAGSIIFRNWQTSRNKVIEMTTVKRGTLTEYLTVSGSITAEQQATLKFQTGGLLTWIGVKEGDAVKKYQTVATLDSRSVYKALQQDLNTYVKTRGTFETTDKITYKDLVITDTIKRAIEAAQMNLNNAVLDVEIQKLSVDFARLSTPIEGIVTSISTPQAGVNILATDTNINVVNPKTIYFRANTDQTDVTRLHNGMSGLLTLDAYPDATISGKIDHISFTPLAGETNIVYGVKFVFQSDNSDYKYRIGMAGDLSFPTKVETNVLYVPSRFIKDKAGEKYILVKKKDKTEKMKVTTGIETDTDTQIEGDINTGDTVVL